MAESRSSVPRREALGYETGGRRGCTYLSHLWPRKDTTPALGQRSIYANPAHELATAHRSSSSCINATAGHAFRSYGHAFTLSPLAWGSNAGRPFPPLPVKNLS